MNKTKGPVPFEKERFKTGQSMPPEPCYRCYKCLFPIGNWDVRYSPRKDLLQLECSACGHRFTMLPADHATRSNRHGT